jgi:hypothetical protein
LMILICLIVVSDHALSLEKGDSSTLKYHNICKNINKISLPTNSGSHHLACECSFSFTCNVPPHFSDEYYNLLESKIGGSIIDV